MNVEPTRVPLYTVLWGMITEMRIELFRDNKLVFIGTNGELQESDFYDDVSGKPIQKIVYAIPGLVPGCGIYL